MALAASKQGSQVSFCFSSSYFANGGNHIASKISYSIQLLLTMSYMTRRTKTLYFLQFFNISGHPSWADAFATPSLTSCMPPADLYDDDFAIFWTSTADQSATSRPHRHKSSREQQQQSVAKLRSRNSLCWAGNKCIQRCQNRIFLLLTCSEGHRDSSIGPHFHLSGFYWSHPSTHKYAGPPA